MKTILQRLGLTSIATAALTVPAQAHPFHGFQASGPLHSFLHALDSGGFVVAGLTLLLVTVVTIRRSRPRACDPKA